MEALLETKLYLLHPIAVHFPIAILTIGLAVACFSKLKISPVWVSEAVSWLLWLGTASAWKAMALGFLAEDTAPHVPLAWHTLNTHKAFALWTVGFFTILSLWRWRFGRRGEWFFIIGWLIGESLLLGTGFYGGKLVFIHGMGMPSLE